MSTSLNFLISLSIIWHCSSCISILLSLATVCTMPLGATLLVCTISWGSFQDTKSFISKEYSQVNKFFPFQFYVPVPLIKNLLTQCHSYIPDGYWYMSDRVAASLNYSTLFMKPSASSVAWYYDLKPRYKPSGQEGKWGQILSGISAAFQDYWDDCS